MTLVRTIIETWHRWRASRLEEQGERRMRAAARDFDRALDHQFAAERIRNPPGEGDARNARPP